MLGLIFTYGLTALGAMLGPFRPFYALLIYVCFAIVKPESAWPWSVPVWNYSRVVGVSMLIGWAVYGFGKWDFGKARGIVMALILYGLWSVLGAAFSSNQYLGWTFVEKQAKIILPFLVGITLIDSIEKLKMLCWTLVLSQGFLALRLHELYWEGIHEYAGPDVFTYAGLDNNSIAIGMCTGVGLAFFMGLHVKRLWERGICFLAAAMMAHSVQFMFSRGGMVALMLTGFVSMFLVPRHPKHFLYFLLAVTLSIALAGKEVRERLSSAFVDEKTRDEAAGSRLRQWGFCLEAIQSHPVLGVGPDHWPIAREYNWDGGEAHSIWLHVAAEMGIPGLIFLASFYLICMRRLFPFTQMDRVPFDPWIQACSRMVIASLIGFSVSAQFVSLKDLEQPFYVTLVGGSALRLLHEYQVAATAAWQAWWMRAAALKTAA